MFLEILGLPMHPVAVHAPVVLVPLLVLGALVYAVVPRLRGYVGWAAVLLAVAAPLSTVTAKLSGEAYRDVLYGTAPLPDDHPIEVHSGYGDLVMWTSIGLGATTLALALLRRGGGGGQIRQWLNWLLAGVVVVLAVLLSYYVFQVGHSGAEMVHGGRIPGS